MSYLAKRGEWYWAELIHEITIEGDERNVIHKNLILIHATGPEQAYESANEIGLRQNSRYLNPAGVLVQSRFRGLGGLDIIHDDLEHGSEILYEEIVSVPEERIKRWIRAQKDLQLFQTGDDVIQGRPDFSSKEIADEVERRLKTTENER